jgi:uncharacterized membrane protein
MTERLLGVDPATATGGEALLLLTRAALRVAVVLSVVLVLGALALRGTGAAVTALLSAIVLVGLHIGSGALTARLSRDNPNQMPVITMAALLLRLVIYGVLVVVLGDVDGVDVPALAVTVTSLTVAMIVVEARLVVRYSKFWWQPTDPAGAAAGRSMERTEA